MPDLVFTNGSVFTAVSGAPDASTVVVRDGRIVGVGGADVRDLASADAEVVDLAGGLLVPGFQDAHVHPVGGGLERMRCNLTGEPVRRDAYLAAVGRYADAHPEREWITGGGWAMAAFPGG